MKNSRKIITIVAHAAAWICFYLLPFIFLPNLKELSDEVANRIIVFNTCSFIFLAGFYYLNTTVLIPKLLFQKKWTIYFISIIICLIGFLYIPRETAKWINGTKELFPKPDFSQRRKMAADTAKFNPGTVKNYPQKNFRNQPRGFRYVPGSYAVFMLVFAIGTCITVMQQWIKTERNKERVETEKLNTELSFLKSQVNPHFFFNTLNNIYSLAIVQSEKTAPAVLKLSSIMRYILTETQNDFVPLENEISFVRNYIDLQLVRLTDKVKVAFTADILSPQIQIAPLLFIPFVENAFKYGISTKENSAINIELTQKGKEILLFVSNNIVHTDATIHETTGIGINNVKRRLELLYPDKFKLQVSDDGKFFTVHLSITT